MRERVLVPNAYVTLVLSHPQSRPLTDYSPLFYPSLAMPKKDNSTNTHPSQSSHRFFYLCIYQFSLDEERHDLTGRHPNVCVLDGSIQRPDESGVCGDGDVGVSVVSPDVMQSRARSRGSISLRLSYVGLPQLISLGHVISDLAKREVGLNHAFPAATVTRVDSEAFPEVLHDGSVG